MTHSMNSPPVTAVTDYQAEVKNVTPLWIYNGIIYKNKYTQKKNKHDKIGHMRGCKYSTITYSGSHISCAQLESINIQTFCGVET